MTWDVLLPLPSSFFLLTFPPRLEDFCFALARHAGSERFLLLGLERVVPLVEASDGCVERPERETGSDGLADIPSVESCLFAFR